MRRNRKRTRSGPDGGTLRHRMPPATPVVTIGKSNVPLASLLEKQEKGRKSGRK